MVYKHEPVRFLMGKAEKGGMNSRAYNEARRTLRDNYGLAEGEKGELEIYAQVAQTL